MYIMSCQRDVLMCKNNFDADPKWTKMLKGYKAELSKGVLLVISTLTLKVTLV